MAYLIVISSGDLSQKLTEWKCNIQGLALPNTTLNQQTLKRNLNVTHLQCFDVFLAFLETIFRLLKDENKTRLNSKKKNSYSDGPFTIYCVGGKGGGRLLRRVLGFKGGKLGDQSSLTELKGEDIKKIDRLTLRGEGGVIRILQSFRGGSGQSLSLQKKLSDPPRAIDNDQSLSGCLRINWVVKMSIKFHDVYTPDGHMLENILINENFSCNINVSPQPTSCNLWRIWGS